MFVGATGPLVMLFFLHQSFSRDELVVHNAIGNVGADLIKILGFWSLGFSYAAFWPHIAALAGGMTAAAFAANSCADAYRPAFLSLSSMSWFPVWRSG